MTREIKFRAWDKKDRTMLDWTIVQKAAFASVEMNSWEMMQYTGLKDSKGAEIYEGDIVRALTDGEEDVFEIKWLEEREYSGWEIGVNTECEVIGNVWENPELVKKLS